MDCWSSKEGRNISIPTTSKSSEKDVNSSPATSLKCENGFQTFIANENYGKIDVIQAKDESEDSLENDEKEKTDATPENLKKIDDVILSPPSYCIGSEGRKNILGEKYKTTTENKIVEDNNSNTDMRHNWNVNYVNKNGSPAEISLIKQENEKKMFEKKLIDNIDFKTKADEQELKIVELDDISNAKMSSNDDDSSTKLDTSLSSSQNSFAFTIDFGKGANSGNSNAEAKYKSMLERFQNRHKRGTSLSKVEINSSNSKEHCGTMLQDNVENFVSNLNIASSNKRNNCDKKKTIYSEVSNILTPTTINSTNETTKVKMRIRERSTSGIRDQVKRHSWSPRSSAVEQDGILIANNKLGGKQSKLLNKTNQILQMELNSKPQNKSLKISDKFFSDQSKSNVEKKNRDRQILSSTRTSAMQIALEKIDFLCQQPPLDNMNDKQFENCGSDDVSEAGTYTLDGDNYTEEQKDLMNIDKSKLNKLPIQHDVLAYDVSALHINNRPTDLPISNKNSVYIKNLTSTQRKNILEISYHHDSAIEKPKISYLDKFKSRMKSKKSPEKLIDDTKINAPASSPTGDMGTFTSITTSGVLAKKASLDSKPVLTRKTSLTKSQIDSSEYVSSSSLGNVGEGNFNNKNEIITNTGANAQNSQMSHSFTDHQKAEYRLNIFSNQSDSKGMLTDFGTGFISESPRSIDLKISDTAVLKTALSKNDWIQEWARNARARSVTSTIKPTDHHHRYRVKSGVSGPPENMSRSYNFDYSEENNSVFSDNGVQVSAVLYSNKPIERFKSHAIGDHGLEYASSDPNVSQRSNGSPTANLDSCSKANYSRPPLSPSKIPSPLHSIGRTRSISKTRSSLQDLSPSGVVPQKSTAESDCYMQKTAAPVSNLSRKNSIKSLSSSNQSPKRIINAHHLSADEYSPPGHNTNKVYKNIAMREQYNSNLHRRNLSFDYKNQVLSNTNHTKNGINLMSQSYSNEMNNFSDSSNEFRLIRPRKNSFDSLSQRNQKNLFCNQLLNSSPIRKINSSGLNQQQLHRNQRYIDQTYSIKQNPNQINKRQISQQQDNQQNNLSPLRRSSSFSAKPLSSSNINIGNSRYLSLYKTVTPITAQKYISAIAKQQQQNVKNPLQKSASSNSFRKMYSDYDDTIAYYINDEDDLDYCSSEEFEEPCQDYSMIANTENETGRNELPLTNTRYNKALLMRIERSKQKVSGSSGTKPAPGGVMACPNTPELPRRSVQSANVIQQRSSMRQSVPRDSSLNRLKGEVPNSLASAKKQILQTAKTTATSTQPRYLDISKYKPVQGASFLKRDESKITLQKGETKKSPSNVTSALTRTDPARVSNRSIKSAGSINSKPQNSNASNKSARDSSVSKQKEVELEMWRRRAKYDPMRAAAEDKRKKEDAKKQTKSSDSSVFLRSQSYHCGVVGLGNNNTNNRWTESSDEDGAYISSSTTTTN